MKIVAYSHPPCIVVANCNFLKQQLFVINYRKNCSNIASVMTLYIFNMETTSICKAGKQLQCSVALLLFTFISPPLLAEDLIEIFQLAQQHDPRWAAARASRDASQEKLPQGRALLLPSVTLQGAYIHNRSDTNSSGLSNQTTQQNGQQSFDSREYGINLTHPLFRKQNYASYQQAESQVRLADQLLAIAAIDLVTRTSQAYFDYLAARDALDLANNEIAAYTEQLEQATEQFRAGVVAITDTEEAKTRLELANGRRDGANTEVVVKTQQLRRIINQLPKTISRLDETLPLLPLDPEDSEKWVEIAYLQNPAILSQQQNVRIAEWEVAKNQAALFPTLDLVAGITNAAGSGNIYTNSSNNSLTSRVGVELQLPLYQGGAISSRVREASANLVKSVDDLEDVRRETEFQIRQYSSLIAMAASQIKSLKLAVQSSERALDSMKAGQDAGLRTRTDVLNTQQQLFSIKRDLLRTRYDYYLNMIKLKANAGSLSDDDLRQINSVLTNKPPETVSDNAIPVRAHDRGLHNLSAPRGKFRIVSE